MPEGEGTPPGSGELVSRARIRVSGHLGGAMAEAVDSRSECCLSRPAKSTIPCGVVGPTVSSMSHSTMLRWRSLLGVQPPYPTTRLSMLRRTVTRRKSSSSALKNASIHMPFSRSFGGVSCSDPPTIRAIQNHRGTGWYPIPTWRYVRSLRSVGFRHPGVDV